jgi:chromosome segregation ATPase
MQADSTQQRLAWLDEEHRRDKTLLSNVQTQIDQHMTEITGMRRALQDLEERLARVQSQSLRYSQIEQALGQLKTEMSLLFDQFTDRVGAREQELAKIRALERERLEARVGDLYKKIDELAGTQKNFGEDHVVLRRVESAQVTFIRGLEETNKKIEPIPPRIQVLEEWPKRVASLMAEVQQIVLSLRQERSEALDAARRADQQRTRQIAEWTDQMKGVRNEFDGWIDQLRPLLDVPKETRQYITTLRDLEERIKQLETRLTQWQRVVDESRHREFDEIRTDLERRWQQQLNEWAFLREEWNKRSALIAQRVDGLEEWRPAANSDFSELRDKMDADRQKMLSLLSDVINMQLEMQRGHNARFDQTASDILARLQTEKGLGKEKRVKKLE